MKVILQENIEKLGSIGDIIEVKSGYARNFLIPRNLAFAINTSNKKTIEARTASTIKKKEEAKNRIEDLMGKIQSCVIAIPMKVTEDGDRLYGSVSQSLIKDNLEAQGIDVEERSIVIIDQIKTLGEHKVRFDFEYNYKLEKTISVISEE